MHTSTHRVRSSKDLDVRRSPLEGATAELHSHPDHHHTGRHLVHHLHTEAARLGVGDVEASHRQPVLHLLLVVHVEEVVA